VRYGLTAISIPKLSGRYSSAAGIKQNSRSHRAIHHRHQKRYGYGSGLNSLRQQMQRSLLAAP
jgi:hypothetical protein